MGLKLVSNVSPMIQIEDVYEGTPPYTIGSFHPPDLKIGELNLFGLAFHNWHNALIWVQVSGINGTFLIKPTPNAKYMFPEGNYKIKVMLGNTKELSLINAGYASGTSRSILSLISGGIHEFTVLSKRTVLDVKTRVPEVQYTPIIRCEAVPPAISVKNSSPQSCVSSVVLNQTGINAVVKTYLDKAQVLYLTTTAPQDTAVKIGTKSDSIGIGQVSVINTALVNNDINVDLRVL